MVSFQLLSCLIYWQHPTQSITPSWNSFLCVASRIPHSPGFLLPHGLFLFCSHYSFSSISLSWMWAILRLSPNFWSALTPWWTYSFLNRLYILVPARLIHPSSSNFFQIPGLHSPLLIHNSIWKSHRHLTFNMFEDKLLSAPPQTYLFHGSFHLVNGKSVPLAALANDRGTILDSFLTPHVHNISKSCRFYLQNTYKVDHISAPHPQSAWSEPSFSLAWINVAAS